MTIRRLRLLAVALCLALLPASEVFARARKTVIFDLDDTLIGTEQVYVRAAKDFKKLAVAAGLDGDKAAARLQEVDLEMFKTLGLTPARYPTSMAETIRELTGDAKLAERARAIGKTVFTQRERHYPNARRVLDEYRRLGYRVILLTKGDRPIQERRIARSGLAGFFDHVEIVPTKDAGSYRGLIQRFRLDPSRTFVIGNSFKSDIATAHEAGIPGKNTVWMSQRLMWKHELVGVNARDARTKTLRATSLVGAKALTLDRARKLPRR